MTRRALGIAGLLVLLVVLALVPAARAQLGPNIVANGSFESPSIHPVGFVTHSAPSPLITGWIVQQGSVDHIGSHWQAAQGLHSIDLNGASQGTLRQDLATEPGEKYLLRFAMAGNPDGQPAVKSMDVEWNNTVVDSPTFATVLGMPTRASMGWMYHEVTVTATSPLTTLRFISTTSGVPPFYGPALDDVSVQQIEDDDDDDDDGDGDDDDDGGGDDDDDNGDG